MDRYFNPLIWAGWFSAGMLASQCPRTFLRPKHAKIASTFILLALVLIGMFMRVTYWHVGFIPYVSAVLICLFVQLQNYRGKVVSWLSFAGNQSLFVMFMNCYPAVLISKALSLLPRFGVIAYLLSPIILLMLICALSDFMLCIPGRFGVRLSKTLGVVRCKRPAINA